MGPANQMMSQEDSFETKLLWFLGIIFVALFVREFVYLAGQYKYINGDELYYLKFATRFNEEGKITTWFWLPGWPVLLASFLKIGGVFAGRQATMIIASLNCGMVYLLGQRLWGHRVGLICGVLMCFFPSHIIYSHFIYAEIGLEWILVVFSLLLVYANTSDRPFRYLVPAYLILGMGMLYKHFVIFCFLGSVATFFIRKNRSWILPCLAIFFVPLFFFSIYLKTQNADPLYWLDSPLKSAQEWERQKIRSHFKADQRKEVLQNHLEFLKTMKPFEILRHSYFNAKNLWGMNKYVTHRLKRYRGVPTLTELKWLFSATYVAIVMLGIYGYARSLPNFFNFYSLFTLLFLTSASVFVFMVSRYQVPFLFFFVLFAGFGIRQLTQRV